MPVVLSTDTLFAAFGGQPFPGSLHPDSNRFIFAQFATTVMGPDDVASEPLQFLVATDWFEELRQRMGNQ